jgi:FAD/FMN-containing dehydrogenase
VGAPDEASLLASLMTAPPEPFVPAELTTRKVVALVGCWCGDLESGPDAIAQLRALGPAADLFGPMPYPALQGMLDAAAPAGLRNYFRGGYSADLSDELIAIAVERAATMTSPMSAIHFHQMGGRVGRIGAETSSFSGRAAGYTYNLIGTWMDEADDAEQMALVRASSEAFAPLSMSTTYVNFAGEAASDTIRTAYGDDIYERLSRLKREYDPGNLFNRNPNVHPAP